MASDRKAKQQKFLDAYSKGTSLSASARIAGVDRRTVYFWKEEEDFARHFADAYDEGNDVVDDEILRRGVTGYGVPMVSMGKVVYEEEPVLDENDEQVYDSKFRPKMKRGPMLIETRYSDSLLTLLAKSRMPKYRDKQQIDLTAHVTTMAEQAKHDLLADLAAMMPDEDKEQSHSE